LMAMAPAVNCTLTTFGCIGRHQKPIKVAIYCVVDMADVKITAGGWFDEQL
jgi:hypothetical protein